MKNALRLLLPIALMIASCGKEDLTQLMVVIDTDFQVPGELDEIRIEIVGPSGNERTAESPVTDVDDLPMRLAIVHRGGPLGPVTVKVEGYGPLMDGRRGIVIQRRAIVDFVEGEVRILQMDLLRACQDVVCGSDQTCAGGDCRPRRVGEDELVRWDGPMRTDFGVPDMGPADMDVDGCVPAEEICDFEDNDCDGRVDEETDTDVDMLNCGACGNECNPNPTRGSTTCEMGECVLTCDDGFGDCNMDADEEEDSDGCEESLMTAANCGSCGADCSGGTPTCDIDVCVSDCPDGTDLCPGGTCADLQSSVSNCGTCGMECADGPNASPNCIDATCGLRCDLGFFNCDMAIGNGCESRLADNANCGACGVACGADNTDATTCATGDCAIALCTPGYQDCDGDVMNGCEADVDGDPATCGGCDTSCPADPTNATAVCVTGACDIACDPGHADCDMDPGNGCETFLGDPGSCNGCAIVCDGATPLCSGSTTTGFECTAGCAAGETTCDMSCVDITTDVANCNGCDMPCADPMRASPTCTGGVCGFTCDMGFDDCDDDPMTGCERSITTTTDCGSCDNACDPAPDATVACSMTGCTISGCTGTKRNCDGVYATGCETDITNSTSHCGGCGAECVPGTNVAGVACEDSGCTITSCLAGFADCDGDFATGCEQRLGVRNHCSACDDRCTGGGTNRCCDFSCGSC